MDATKRTRLSILLLAIPAVLGIASVANAIEYSAPGDPYKIQVFNAQTEERVCVSRSNFCDVPAGEYFVKVTQTRGTQATVVEGVELTEGTTGGGSTDGGADGGTSDSGGSADGGSSDGGSNTDTLAELSCSAGQIAKFSTNTWVCAEDNDTQATQSSIEDLLANLGCAADQRIQSTSGEGWVCVDSKIVQCPFIIQSLYTTSVLTTNGMLPLFTDANKTAPTDLTSPKCGWSASRESVNSGNGHSRSLYVHYGSWSQVENSLGSAAAISLSAHYSDLGDGSTTPDVHLINESDIINDLQVVDACAVLIGCPTLTEYNESLLP